MNLHHLVTCSLFVGMILQNYIRVGVIISWLHSVSDITTGFSRILSHTLYKSAALVSFSICIVKWIYLRNICIPIVCYNIWMYLNYYNELTNFFIASRILALLVTVLCAMHIYWLSLFFNMIYKAIKTGNTDD